MLKVKNLLALVATLLISHQAIASQANSGTPSISGDVSIPSGSTTAILATVNSNVGSFGDSNAVPVLTLDGKGRVTAASTAATVGSFNGRSGSVSPTSGDYTVSQVTGAAPLASPTFTGTVTIPSGASIAGFAPLASPTFTGTVNGAAVVWSDQNKALNFSATGTGADTLPVGTTGQRPSGVEGMIRDNTTLGYIEAYLNGVWTQVSGIISTNMGGFGSANSFVNVNAYYSGSGTWTNAFNNALTAASALGVPVYCPAGTYNMGTGSISIDVGTTSIISPDGGRCTLQWSAAPTSGIAVSVVESVTSYPQNLAASKIWAKNVAFLGSGSSGTMFSAIGVAYAGTSSNNVHNITSENLNIWGFTILEQFIDNDWRIESRDCKRLWGGITTPSSFSNYGEVMVYDHCMFNGNGPSNPLTINSGEWHFIGGTSLDGVQLNAYNTAQVFLSDGHMEDIGRTDGGFPYIQTSGNGFVSLMNETMLSDSAGVTRTSPLIANGATVGGGGGVWIYGGFFSQTNPTYYNTLSGYNQQTYISGSGPTYISGVPILAYGNSQWEHFGYGASQLQNGNFETGTTAGWAAFSYGGVSSNTFTASTTSPEQGMYSGYMSAVYTSGSTAYSGIHSVYTPCHGGDNLLGGIWGKRQMASSGSGSSTTIQLSAYDSGFNTISGGSMTYINNTNRTNDSWTYFPLGGVVPNGASWCAINIILGTAATGTAAIYLDDAVLNDIHNGS